MGIRGIIKDIILIYLGLRLLGIWWFDKPFTTSTGVLVLIMLFTSIWFSLERLGLIGKFY